LDKEQGDARGKRGDATLEPDFAIRAALTAQIRARFPRLSDGQLKSEYVMLERV
jgi:hypothetical protein